MKKAQTGNGDNVVKFDRCTFGSGKIILLLTGICIFMVILFSQILNASGPKLPQEAFTACQDKNVGTDCSFTPKPTRMHGICKEGPNSVMACAIPLMLPPPKEANHGRQLPAEIFSACAGINSGDTCSLALSLPKISGICRNIKAGNSACISRNMPLPPSE